MPKLALVVNEPPPYRIPIFNRLAAFDHIDLKVFFFCHHEPNRFWNCPEMKFDHEFLRENIYTVNGRYIHNNPDVVLALNRFDPDVVIGNGFNPTHLYAMLWTMLRRRTYVPMTDGTQQSEISLSKIHRWIRQFTYSRGLAFIAASQGGMALYQSYGVRRDRCYQSSLCTDNARFQAAPAIEPKRWDFIFCGRLEPAKSPDFSLDVAVRCSQRLGRRVSILLVGSGSMESELKQKAQQLNRHIDVHFAGFAKQEELPGLYQSAKIFLFPTKADVWGVVANEACAAGLPVLITPYAGAAGELIIDGKNGFIRELDADAWSDCAIRLLQNEKRREAFGKHSQLLVKPYDFDAAARGILEATMAAYGSQRDGQVAVSRPV
jgi:glycosyltransferase involved in cell wall biosynthesis